MKHAISFYIDDDAEITGFYGSVHIETNNDESISSFNLNKKQLTTKNAWYAGRNGEGLFIADTIDHARECALEVVRENLNNGGPFAYEEWCKCTHCGYKQALFIPRNYCPKCGYKFTSIIHKGDAEKEDKDE